jgi:hypothetical protein
MQLSPQPSGSMQQSRRGRYESPPRALSGSTRWVEMNTQDSDEDPLFMQEMRFPERGAGGFSGSR